MKDQPMNTPKTTLRAQRKCAEFLAFCLRIGWSKDQLDGLEETFWKFRSRTTGELQPSP